jgi:hypothetical protein
MSNTTESSTEIVEFRHQALVAKAAVRAFREECKQRKVGPAKLLQLILEERYEKSGY